MFIKLNYAISIMIIYLFISNSAIAQVCDIPKKPGITQLIAHGAILSRDIQTDFGRLKKSSICYFETWPETTHQVANLVKVAYKYNIAIRTQGASHSQNGASLPHHYELLIHTSQLNEINFKRLDYISVGAGIPIALLNSYLQQQTSFFLPVINKGIGPSVGGFISAGGINNSSQYYGGFWENVHSITLVTGDGKILKLTPHDSLFLYLFGSMGQLGIITEAELNILPYIAQSYRYPLGKKTHLNIQFENGNYWAQKNSPKALYWFNLFVPLQKLNQARKTLINLKNKYPHALNYVPIYQWKIKFISLMPPLVYDKKQDFFAIGIWGRAYNSNDAHQKLKKLDCAFSQIVLKEKYKRYIQAELAGSPQLYKHYFPKKTYMTFKKIKRQLDPKFLFNQGSFFATI